MIIRANNGLLVCAEQGGGLGAGRKDALIANRSGAGLWETFTREDQGNGWFALRTHTGHYVQANHGGGGALVTDAIGPAAFATFRLGLDGSVICFDGRHRWTVRMDLEQPFVDATGLVPGGTFRFE